MVSACGRMNKWQAVPARQLIRHYFTYVAKLRQITRATQMVRQVFMWIG